MSCSARERRSFMRGSPARPPPAPPRDTSGRFAPPPSSVFLFGARFRPDAALASFDRYLETRQLGELTLDDYSLLAELREHL